MYSFYLVIPHVSDSIWCWCLTVWLLHCFDMSIMNWVWKSFIKCSYLFAVLFQKAWAVSGELKGNSGPWKEYIQLKLVLQGATLPILPIKKSAQPSITSMATEQLNLSQREHRWLYLLCQRMKSKSDCASGSSSTFAGNIEDRGTSWIAPWECSWQNPYCAQFCRFRM